MEKENQNIPVNKIVVPSVHPPEPENPFVPESEAVLNEVTNQKDPVDCPTDNLIIDENNEDSNKRKRNNSTDTAAVLPINKKSRFEWKPKRCPVLRVPPVESPSVRISNEDGNLRFVRKVNIAEYSFYPSLECEVSVLGKSISALKAE